MIYNIAAIQLADYRQRTFHLRQRSRLTSIEAALRFVDARGFIFFWPIKAVTLPSLWTAVAGNRAVADAHDDPGHITWRWKDEMLDKRKWYYAKVLRGKSTIISLNTSPYFYALSDNYGDPDHDYLQLYEDGLLSREAKLIYEALLRHGPLNTVRLRQICQMTGKASSSPFERGLASLQRDFKILPVGVAEAGAWRYSFIYELVHRYYPDLPEKARPIKRKDARLKLASLFFSAVGAAASGDLRKLFQWQTADIDHTLQQMVESRQIEPGCTVEGYDGDHFAVRDLLGV
jgi:hypothetical protein